MATQELTLQQKIEQARTVVTNLKSFKDWSFAAYKIEAREKDIIMEGMSYFLDMLTDTQKAIEEGRKDNENTELCE